ncbi:MAG: TRIC cation channel family protein, partial [Bacteroidota bacterium]
FKEKVIQYRRSMFLFDTVGIGLFTILGIQIALEQGLHTEHCLIMGVISACFGGVIRDTLANEIPLIFRREIYATACLAGGAVYLILRHLSPFENVNIVFSMLIVMFIRYLSIKRNWSLNIHREE